MRTRFVDVFWIAVGSVVIFSVFVAILALPGGRGNILALLIGVVPMTLVGLGCWRRTKWGAPEDGLRAAQERRATDGKVGGRPPAS